MSRGGGSHQPLLSSHPTLVRYRSQRNSRLLPPLAAPSLKSQPAPPLPLRILRWMPIRNQAFDPNRSPDWERLDRRRPVREAKHRKCSRNAAGSAPQRRARRCLAVNTTATCRGCLQDPKCNDTGCRLLVSIRVVASGGVAGGVAGGAAQKPR